MKKIFIFSIATILAVTNFAQTDQGKIKNEKVDVSKAVKYTCPMHSDVISGKPGKCPKCGMTLVVKKVAIKNTYSCPMDSDVISDKAGKCPKCGMNLVEKKTK